MMHGPSGLGMGIINTMEVTVASMRRACTQQWVQSRVLEEQEN